MPNETLHVNEGKVQTIIRVVHNRENPFVQLNKHALWDKDLSLKAVGLWARCMSRPDDWVFSMKELISKCLEGRRAVDGAMQELIEHNYACRLIYSPKDQHGKFTSTHIEYIFFEFPASQEDKDLQMEKFKKCFRDCGLGNFRFCNRRNEHLLIKSSTEIQGFTEKDSSSLKVSSETSAAEAADEKREIPKRKEKIKHSPEVKELGHQMIRDLQDCNPHWRPPKTLDPIFDEVHEMVTTQERDPKTVMRVFRWVINNGFWMPKISKPNPAKYLNIKFGQLAGEMEKEFSTPKKERRFAPSSDDEKAAEKFRDMNSRAI